MHSPQTQSDEDVAAPPHSAMSEQAVLGAILFDTAAFPQVIEIIASEDFYHAPHQLIFKACCELFALGEPLDVITISEKLKDNGGNEYTRSGGSPYLMDLALSVGTSENVIWHAEKIKGHSTRRKIQVYAYDLIATAQHSDENTTLEFAQNEILKITQGSDRKKDLSTPELIVKVLDDMQDRLHHPNKPHGIRTGFVQLDRVLGGLKPGRLIILGARPSMGKTALALNIGTNVVLQQKLPVLVFSLEMDPEELMERALVSIAESSADLNRLQAAGRTIPDILKLIDRPGLTTTQLRASLIKNRLEVGQPGLVIVDYLQLMKGVGGTRNEEVSSISRDLKQIAREFKMPLMALAQLSREVERRMDKRPIPSDLRDSGSIEADADTVMFIYRDEYYNKDSDKRGIAEVIVAKNRGGMIGNVELVFRPAVVKFFNNGNPEML
jgi:replicative DNA helicase